MSEQSPPSFVEAQRRSAGPWSGHSSSKSGPADVKEIAITVRFSDPSISVLSRPDRLQQVVWNLLSNAIKFTPEQGSVSIDVDRVDPSIQIRVRDTGIGIDSGFLPYVFDRFRQSGFLKHPSA